MLILESLSQVLQVYTNMRNAICPALQEFKPVDSMLEYRNPDVMNFANVQGTLYALVNGSSRDLLHMARVGGRFRAAM